MSSTPPTPPKNLYICIECSSPVQSLYTAYSSADDHSLGRGVRLTQCPRCKRFADKYVEHDFVVLFIDLVLIKPQVYRHLLFNRLGREDDRFENIPTDPLNTSAFGILTQQPIVVQYLFFLLLCLTESFLFHLTIRLISQYLLGATRPNAVSTALIVSSCTKLFPILMVIWNYEVPAAAKSVGWAVVVNNVEALRISLGIDYFRAAGLAGAGAVVRAIASQTILGWTGLLGDNDRWGGMGVGIEEWVGRLGLGK
ncbi:Arv1-domain-containing protein [Choiromyces venosus 120613-1]|uniref:Protein ARV n=1 Tax=Choiromyces venosus 120613-1 TaxID=1336337 RepID=A0A3N4JI30_9PEZI|nr:Arv1-domain-containing protein [Choiromyces venosus 120613-1]